MIVSDALGVFEAFTPKFVKRYAEVAKASVKALAAYHREVKDLKFPESKHTYSMIPEERVKFEKWARTKKK
jgi:3-methyl-2-oxobutanoate hydroxymethyltransferase